MLKPDGRCADTTGMTRPAPRSDDGVSLVEVVVALFVFGLLATAVLATLTRSLELTTSNDRRAAALNVAARQIEVARATATADLASTTSPLEVRVDGAQYRIEQTVSLIPQGGGSACDGAAGPLAAKRISVSVTWDGMGLVGPVRTDTIKALSLADSQPDKGAISVKVVDRTGAPAAGHVVTLKPGNLTATTSSDGCVVFPGLTPGTRYTATLSTAGYVDPRGVAKPLRSDITVTASGLTKDPGFVYDRAGTLTVQPDADPTFPVPPTVGVGLANSADTTDVRSYPICGPAPCVTSSRTVTGLFPAEAGWQAWLGTCADARPAGLTAVAFPPGGSATATAPTAPVEISVVDEDGNPKNRQVFAIHFPDSGCEDGEKHILGPGSVIRASLPAGRWFLGNTDNNFIDVTLTAGAAPRQLTVQVES